MPGAPGILDKVVRIRPAQGGAGAFNQKDLVVAASQTIKMYDLVMLVSNKVQQALSLHGTNGNVTTSNGSGVLGVALADITTGSGGSEAGTGRTTIPVAILDSNLEVLLRLYNSTAANSQQAYASLALGTAYNYSRYRVDANNWFYVLNTAAPSSGELKYVEPSAESQPTDNYGLVWVRPVLSDSVRQG